MKNMKKNKSIKFLACALGHALVFLPVWLAGGCGSAENGGETPEIPEAPQWVALELAFQSEKNFTGDEIFVAGGYELDLVFTSEKGTVLTVPGFWDGGGTWKARFAPTETGSWTYLTKFTDTKDHGLHGQKGSILCVPYEGGLDIYKRGFVKAEPGKKHFTYADGTPFFYLGDTHWSMPGEPFDTMFKAIVDDRAKKGFTVYQSEPLGAKYNLAGGFDESTLEGFRDLDERFSYIAKKGLVHANAQFFFAAELGWNRAAYTDEYLEKLARHWAARYAAYPVMWTTAQEADKDFYATFRNEHSFYGPNDNPWRIVFEAVHKYDPYGHPATAHQENTASTRANDSSFKDLPGHDWFAAQWSPALSGRLDFGVAKEYWDHDKICVNYEGRYENLWTKESGARIQGWIAYLNGMFGYGYGAIDIWLYNSTYDMDTTSNDGIEAITPEDKAVKWQESINFAASSQMGYMRDFFEKLEWWTLIPRFGDADYFQPQKQTLYSIAGNMQNSLIVIYFYNLKNTHTGVINGLSDKAHSFVWYDPANNRYYPEIEIFPSGGSYNIGEKPDIGDWVLVISEK